jgi:hypothetical protein
MHSSTSASKSAGLAYAKVLMVICAAVVVALEIASGYLLRDWSTTYKRISEQHEEAVKMYRGGPGEPPAVLMVGNSLLLQGVELDRLRALTSSSMRIYPIFLEATGYYDWLYALRRLFREGAKPQVVVVGVGVNYFVSNGVRQEYVPMLFLDGRDLLSVASDVHLDRTGTSNLLLAHFSTFWDTRNAIRMQILKRLVPHLQELFLLVSPTPAIPEKREFEQMAIPRLQMLSRLCEANGSKLLLLIPPTLSSQRAVSQMAGAAHLVGVDVLVPIDPASLPAKFYEQDGMHLNRDGAMLFTTALARDLPEKVVADSALAWRYLSPRPDTERRSLHVKLSKAVVE